MKHIIALTIALLSVATLSAQEVAQSTSDNAAAQDSAAQPLQLFGFVSYNEMLQAMPEYGKAVDRLVELGNIYDEEMERAEAEFSRKFYEFVEKQKTFPDNIMLKRQKELQQLMDESLQFKEEAKQLLQAQEEELMQPLRQRLQNAIREVGLEHNYAYILNTDNNSYLFINTTEGGEDCSDYVLEKLKQ